jgi:hypothetical protein
MSINWKRPYSIVKEARVRYHHFEMKSTIRVVQTGKLVCALLAFFLLGAMNGVSAQEKDGGFQTTSGRESWDYLYDISKLAPGKYNLIIEGADKAGNKSIAGPFNVYVDPKSDLPVTTISSPTPGMRAGGALNIVGTCVDDDGVDHVEVRLDSGEFAKADGKEYWSYSLDAAPLADGPHTVQARGVDINGVTGESVSVFFNLDTRAPLVRVISHQSGTLASGLLTLAGTVDDANGVESLRLSTDHRATWSALALGRDKDKRSARFTLPVDTRRLKDGPHVYWLAASDSTGSVGSLAFLFFVDNTSPRLEILSPRPGEKVSGIVTVVGKLSEQIGVQSLSWDAGEGKTGTIALTPGDPYWVQDFDLGKERGSSARILFTVVDKVGNRVTRELALPLVPDEADLPVVTVRSPAKGERFGDAVLLSGTVRDDDGVKAIQYSVDGKPPITVACGDAFSAEVTGVPPGAHRVTIHGIDANDRPGKDAAADFVVTGEPPLVRLESLVIDKKSIAFRPGIEVTAAKGAVLTGRISVPGGFKSGTFAVAGSPARQLSTGRSEKPGEVTFTIPLPEKPPAGRIDVRVTARDSFDREGVLTTFAWGPSGGAGQAGPAVMCADPRLGADGSILLSPGEALQGFFSGGSIGDIGLEPPTPFLEASFEGSFIRLTAVSQGVGKDVRVRVTAGGGEVFRSDPLSIRCDTDAPALTVSSPQSGDWVGGKISLKGSVSDANGIASVSYAVGSSPAVNVPLRASADGSAFDAAISLADTADGDLALVVTATDGAGRTRSVALRVLKDTKPPVVSLAAPAASDQVNGIVTLAGVATDDGAIERIEFSQDGASYAALPGPRAESRADFHVDVDLSRAAAEAQKLAFRVTDRSGNTAIFTPVLDIQQANDIPEVQIQVPQDGEVQRNDFVVSGMAFDDDGIGAISWRMDGGEFAKLPGSSSFSIPVALADVSDNEHVIEVKAEDLNGVASPMQAVKVRVSKAEPVSRLVSPALTTTSRDIVTLSGESSDKNGIGEVFLSFDNGRTFNRADGKEKWTYRLDTRILKDGTYSILVKAIDTYGTEGLFTTLLNVDNTPPEVILDAPADGQSLSQSLLLVGRARDGIRLASLTARISRMGGATGGPSASLPTGGAFSQSLDLAGFAPGWYDLTVEGVDDAANATRISRNILVQERRSVDRIDIWFPSNGADLHGAFTVSGLLDSGSAASQAVLIADGAEAGQLTVNERGWFSTTVEAGLLSAGPHTLEVEARFADAPAVRSEKRTVAYEPPGPWIRFTSHTLGQFVTFRPFVTGEAGWAPEAPSDAQAAGAADETASGAAPKAAAKPAKAVPRPVHVDVSFDNGKTFSPAQGAEKWRFRLETQGFPDGPVRLMVRAVFADGSAAFDETMLVLDHTPPQVVLLSPREEGRFNGRIALIGTAHDDNGMAEVRAAVRKGDKASYEVPGFIQGLYFEGHALGATYWDFGVGLTFFDNNVKLQAEVGMAPDGRFSGLVIGAKLLANIVHLPFSYFFGPDWDSLSMSLAVGADFSYVTNSGDVVEFTDKGIILGAVVAQLEFPIVKIRTWPVFNTWSLYTEYQLWFISSDISAGFINRVAFGLRVGLF